MNMINALTYVPPGIYHILPVNSHDYYKFQIEIGATTNQDFNTEIACKAYIYDFQLCTM